MDVPVGEAHRVGYEVVIKKIESYKVTHNGVEPVTPSKRGKPETPAYRGLLVGADAITSNGALINKIGTSQVALAARAFGVPFYVAAETYKFSPYTLAGRSSRSRRGILGRCWTPRSRV